MLILFNSVGQAKYLPPWEHRQPGIADGSRAEVETEDEAVSVTLQRGGVHRQKEWRR